MAHCSQLSSLYLLVLISKYPNMECSNLHRQIMSMKKSFFDQGYLDEQFTQLEELQDETSPNFVEEVVVLFFKDSSRLLTNIEQTLDKYPQDFYRLDSLVHTLKGRGTSIGAVRMKNECSVLKAHCNNKNLEGCRRSLQQMKGEHATLKQKLEIYCQMVRQAGPRERAVNSRK